MITIQNLTYTHPNSESTILVVSHDRTLLNLPDFVCELSRRGIAVYGGNFAFYQEQKRIENNALNEDIRSKEKALRKAKDVERETAERQQKCARSYPAWIK